MAQHIGRSDITRFLLAAGAGIAFSLACLAAALEPGPVDCFRGEALDCPTRL